METGLDPVNSLVKDEAKGMIGENLTTVLILLPILDSDLIVILQIKRRRL